MGPLITNHNRQVTASTSIASTPARLGAAPVRERDPEVIDIIDHAKLWKVIVWNDPINLMSYVTFVLQKLFGYSKDKATRLMLEVHTEGKSVVASGNKEKAELDVFRLHEHGLWATMEQDD